VLKSGGQLIAMLYARRSLNYFVAIGHVRRLALAFLYLPGFHHQGIVGRHIAMAAERGLWRYLRMENFIHANTNGPANPYSKVYDIKTVMQIFLHSAFSPTIGISCTLRYFRLPGLSPCLGCLTGIFGFIWEGRIISGSRPITR
jgi:hypothetical protein